MYLPTKFIKQTDGLLRIPGQPRMTSILLRKGEMFMSSIMSNRPTGIRVLSQGWSAVCSPNSVKDIDVVLNNVDFVRKRFCKSLGVTSISREDEINVMLLLDLRNEWSKSNFVLRINENLTRNLSVQKFPKSPTKSMMVHMPAKCMYLDFDGVKHFGGLEGGFLLWDIEEDCLCYIFIGLVDGSIVSCTLTSGNVIIHDEGSSEIKLQVSEEPVTVVLEAGGTLAIQDNLLHRFILNFFFYMNAANKDVVPIVKEVAKPVKKNSKGKSKKIKKNIATHRYDVGYRVSTPFPSKRVVYKGGSKGDTGTKRYYPDTYRRAHWHTYWVKDEDNAGKKKSVLKWVEGHSVHGNAGSVLVIHDVK